MAAGIDVPEHRTKPWLVTGVKAKGEYRCAGYGISINSTLPRCPMCGTEAWEQLQWATGPQRSSS
jgi:hypothetical protein